MSQNSFSDPRYHPKHSWAFGFIGIMGVILTIGGIFMLKLVMTIPSEGVVLARAESYVFAPEDGKINKIFVNVGQKVKQGEPIFQLDDSEISLEILNRSKEIVQLKSSRDTTDMARRELELRPAKEEVIGAKEKLSHLNRIKTLQEETLKTLNELSKQQLVTRNEINREQVDLIRTEIERMQASLQAGWAEDGMVDLQKERLTAQTTKLNELIALAESEVEMLKKKKEKFQIVSPMDGEIVYNDYRYEGMSVAKGARMSKIALLEGGYRIKSKVGERNVDLIKEGTEARMRSGVFNSVLEGYIKGKVTRITPDSTNQGDASKTSAQYEVEIIVDQTPYSLVLGSTVEIEFLLGRQSMLNLLLKRPEKRRALISGAVTN